MKKAAGAFNGLPRGLLRNIMPRKQG